MAQNNGYTYEENISLLALAAKALRKWKWMLGAVLAGALLLGGYQLLKPAEVKIDEARVKEVKTALDSNKSTLAANETELTANKASIQANMEKIAADEEALAAYRSSRATMEENLAALQASLNRAQSVLANPEATAEATAAVIIQLPTLINDIAAADNEVLTAAKRIEAATDEIAALNAEISTMEARNATLAEANNKLSAQIAEQDAQLVVLQAGKPVTRSVKSIIKNIILGGILGMIAYCGVVFLMYIADKKLRTATELQERYQLPILGEFYSAKAQEHIGFDRKLDKLSGDVQTLPEEESIFELIAAGIMAGIGSPVQLAVTGTAPYEKLETVAERISTLLPEGYAVSVQANPVYNAAFLAQIKEYTVLLVEEKGISEKPEIDRLAEVLRRNGVNVVGAVVR